MSDILRNATEALLLRWLAAIRQRDIDALVSMVSVDCDVEAMTSPGITGRDAIRRVYREWFNAFPDVAVHAQDTIIEDDRGVMVLTIAGTDMGGFMGLPPTGKAFRMTAVMIFTVLNGQVLRYRSVYDFTGLLAQVGNLKVKPV
jgi:steroid delta-isomerase-like uncharacterized protein